MIKTFSNKLTQKNLVEMYEVVKALKIVSPDDLKDVVKPCRGR